MSPLRPIVVCLFAGLTLLFSERW